MTATWGVVALAVSAGAAWGQAVGPDMVNSNLVDVARYGTDAAGLVTSYAIGATSCNRGDLPAQVFPSGNSLLRPLVAQNMFRLRQAPGQPYARFEQVGQGWVKRVGVPGSGNNASCGTCIPSGQSAYMGVGCADVYGSGFNGSQSLLGPRSLCSATLGTISGGMNSAVGDSVTRGRLQVRNADVVGQPVGTRFFAETVHLLPDDATYVRPGQMVAVNAMNNAASQEININGGTATPALAGSVMQAPAVPRWRDIDPNVVLVTVDHDDTPNPNPSFPGTTVRSRFYVGARVTPLAGGVWRYEYVVYNLNSDRGAWSFSVPMSGVASLDEVALSFPPSHSGEPYSNASWGAERQGKRLVFMAQSFEVNPNANAVRWGTMYNFGFTTTAAPVSGGAALRLFRPGPGAADLAVSGLPVPSACPADFDRDGAAGTDADIESFFRCLGGHCCPSCYGADFDGDGAHGQDSDIESFFVVLGGGEC